MGKFSIAFSVSPCHSWVMSSLLLVAPLDATDCGA
jgi:hypothetical protein